MVKYVQGLETEGDKNNDEIIVVCSDERIFTLTITGIFSLGVRRGYYREKLRRSACWELTIRWGWRWRHCD